MRCRYATLRLVVRYNIAFNWRIAALYFELTVFQYSNLVEEKLLSFGYINSFIVFVYFREYIRVLDVEM